MTKLRMPGQTQLPLIWVAFFIGISLAVAILSFTYEGYRAKTSVERYVAIWEDDIAKAKLFQGDQSLQDKVLKQLKEVHSAVGQTEVQNPEKLQCAFSTDVPLTYHSLPSGNIRVCFKVMDLGLSALASPFFMLGMLLGMIFLGVGLRREFLSRLHEQQLEAELALSKRIAQISRQVAHDIRGPLTALTTLNAVDQSMSADKKELLNLAVTRIRGIADDLLASSVVKKSDQAEVVAVAEKAKGVDLNQTLAPLIKEYQFSHSQIEISLTSHLYSEQVLVKLDAIKIQRIISNLLNNAIEALPTSEASIHLTLMERQDHWLLQIMDNGKGIPEEILPTLMQEGVTHGKENGHGLGLFDARNSLKSVGGDLQIRSRVGVGTQVTLVFPKLS